MLALPIIQARETLELIRAFTHPNTKEESQRKLLQQLSKIANPNFSDGPSKAVTTKDIFEKMKKVNSGRR